MQKNEPKFFWHIHHHKLLEFASEPIENRIEFIKNEKPEDEIETRLRLLKPVKGKLPAPVIEAWVEYERSCTEHDKAWAEYDKVRANYLKAWVEWGKAWAEYDKAWVEWGKAWAEYDKVWANYLKTIKTHAKEIEALHEKECPDCPWNGKTIFPDEEG